MQDVISELNNRIYEDTDTEDPHAFRLDITHDFFFSGSYVKGSFSAYAIFWKTNIFSPWYAHVRVRITE